MGQKIKNIFKATSTLLHDSSAIKGKFHLLTEDKFPLCFCSIFWIVGNQFLKDLLKHEINLLGQEFTKTLLKYKNKNSTIQVQNRNQTLRNLIRFSTRPENVEKTNINNQKRNTVIIWSVKGFKKKTQSQLKPKNVLSKLK